jgi:hypothetical protein
MSLHYDINGTAKNETFHHSVLSVNIHTTKDSFSLYSIFRSKLAKDNSLTFIKCVRITQRLSALPARSPRGEATGLDSAKRAGLRSIEPAGAHRETQ